MDGGLKALDGGLLMRLEPAIPTHSPSQRHLLTHRNIITLFLICQGISNTALIRPFLKYNPGKLLPALKVIGIQHVKDGPRIFLITI